MMPHSYQMFVEFKDGKTQVYNFPEHTSYDVAIIEYGRSVEVAGKHGAVKVLKLINLTTTKILEEKDFTNERH